ncbi:MAG: hypothetical protein R3F53_23420 [Gammaproteobacteria bacterium]
MSIATTITAFSSKTTPGAFSHIALADVVCGLKKRTATPGSIHQKGSSLCGPASFWYCILKRKPQLYVDYVTQMYDTGKANVFSLIKEPGSACKNFNPGSSINPVDWIALATMRDAANLMTHYSKPSQEVAGVTFPGEMASWFKAIGYGKGINRTQLFGDMVKNQSHFEQAFKLRQRGYDVCLLVDRNIIEGDTNWFSMVPTHWVVLTKAVKLTYQQTDIEVFTWGSDTYKVSAKTDDFLRCYYGYVLVGR